MEREGNVSENRGMVGFFWGWQNQGMSGLVWDWQGIILVMADLSNGRMLLFTESIRQKTASCNKGKGDLDKNKRYI